MGLSRDFLGGIFSTLFGGRRNIVVETMGAFRENAEGRATRAADLREHALAQFAAEMARGPRGRWDRFIDGLNRLPRPAMAFGTLGLVASAMVAPGWFSARMAGLALVPEPLWWLMGAIVSFYFGARMQAHGQGFEREMVAALSRLRGPAPGAGPPETAPAADDIAPNAALDDWRRAQG